MRPTNIIFYFTHKESLGHITRVIQIVKTIRRFCTDRIRIHVFQAGKQQKYIANPPGVEWINLPAPFNSKADFKYSNYLAFNSCNAAIRTRYMLSHLKKIKPDIFITEFFPFGREECTSEILPVISFLKRKGIKLYSSLGYPLIARKNIASLGNYYALYDRFFIHTPFEFENKYFLNEIADIGIKNSYVRLFAHFKTKISYTGYVLPFDPINLGKKKFIRKKYGAEGKKLVLISRGGGVINPKIIMASILSKKLLPKNFVFIILAGPATTCKEMLCFKKLIKNTHDHSIHLFRYKKDFADYMNACDISVSMAGYNTSVQLLYFKKPSLIITSSRDPETNKGNCSEQTARANLLKKTIQAKLLSYDRLTPEDIAKNILDLSFKKRNLFLTKSFNKLFDGAESTANLILNQ